MVARTSPRRETRKGHNARGRKCRFPGREAGWMLEGFKLDGERRLPMGQGDTAEPKDRKGKTW